MEGENNQEIPKLCLSGCGFFGHQTYQGFCSRCFKDQSADMKFPEKPNKDKVSETNTLNTLLNEKCVIEDKEKKTESPEVNISVSTEIIEKSQEIKDETETVNHQKKKNRCHFCNKKVNLLGFDCRCGNTFCSNHRYSELHHCQYDYREIAQEEIRKANPVVTAKKVDKI